MTRGLHVTCLMLLLVVQLCAADPDPAAKAQPSPSGQAVESDAGSAWDVFFLSERLVTIRYHVLLDGKSVSDAWKSFVDERFKAYDTNGDGKLAGDERRAIPTRRLLEAMNLVQNKGGNNSISKLLQNNPIALISTREDLGRYFEKIGLVPFRVEIKSGNDASAVRQVVESGVVVNIARAGRHLFARLDVDRNGHLDSHELGQAAYALRRDDLDRDETISALELMPNPSGQYFSQREQPDANPATVRFLTRPPGGDGAAIVSKLIAKYDGQGSAGSRDGRLTRAELGIEEPAFVLHDHDNNGMLDPSELQNGLVKVPLPDVLISVRLGLKDATAKPFEARRITEFGANFAETASQASLSFGGSQMEFVQSSNSAGEAAVRSSSPVDSLKALFAQHDRDKNGYIDMQEINQMRTYASIFSELDKDHDQKLFPEEFVDRLAPLAIAADRQSQLTIVEGGFDLFQGLDADEDNRLSTREIQTMAHRVLQWDRNGDKQVGEDELPQRFRLSMAQGQLNNPDVRNAAALPAIVNSRNRQPPTSGPVWFRNMDRNNDGDVSRREFLGNAAAFKKFDRDDNGLIDAQEAK